MRILHLASEFPPARIFGLGRYVHDLGRAQAERGDEVHVMTNSLSGRDQEVQVHGVRVHRINWPSPPMPPDGATQVMIFNVALLERFLEMQDRLGAFDVVVSHDWLTALAAQSIRRRLSCRWVHTMHDTVIGKTSGKMTNEDRYVAHIERHGCKQADATVAVSRQVLEELAGPYEASREKLHAVPAAVSEAWFQSVARELLPDLRAALATPDEKVLTYVGRLDPEKGVDCLIEAFSEVARRFPMSRLVIAGKGGEEDKLRHQVEAVGIQGRVVFLGYVTGGALEALYKVSDLLVCPSTYEPFGIVPLEGMVNGVPVIASDVGGMAEIVEHGRSGLRVPPGDARALGQAMCHLLDRPDEAKRLAIGGRERARGVYNWNRVATLLEPIYSGRAPSTPAPDSPAILRKRPRLTAGIRVKNGELFAEECLKDLSEYVDDIVIFDDGSTDRTPAICRGFPKVSTIYRSERNFFHEGLDRHTLLWLIAERQPEWILLPDIDEVFEARFKREVPALMAREDVALYGFRFCHFWRSRTHYRVDGKWGRETREFPIPRLVRYQPGLYYPANQALGSAQIRGVVGGKVVSDIRVKHYGHLHEDISKHKLDLYSKLDPANDYRFMVDEVGLELEEWKE
ncbi:MAG: glycosyltransferase [Planctomycetes bacterium]|nr:glycosyltransferase [Planctomycetota bacterium]